MIKRAVQTRTQELREVGEEAGWTEIAGEGIPSWRMGGSCWTFRVGQKVGVKGESEGRI